MAAMLNFQQHSPRFIVHLALFFSVLIITGCENSVQIPIPATEYDEKIVIGGILTAGDTLKNIQITRTLRVNEPYLATSSNSGLPDAEVTLNVEGKSYKMLIQPAFVVVEYGGKKNDGRTFFSVPGLIVQSGKRYTITVRWKDKTAQASTVVPFAPAPDSVTMYADAQRYNLIAEATIITRNHEVYFLGQKHQGQRNRESFNLAGYYGHPQRQSSGNHRLLLRSTLAMFDRYNAGLRWLYEEFVSFQSFYLLYAYDEPMWDYYQSQQATSRTSDIALIPSGENLHWNVTGDGIGLFVGAAVTILPVQK